MKYRINDEQQKLINELGKRRKLKEQEFIAQSFSPVQIGESGGGGMSYSIEVTIAAHLGEKGADGIDSKTFFRTAYEDAKEKLESAFQTTNVVIRSISNQEFGTINPDE